MKSAADLLSPLFARFCQYQKFSAEQFGDHSNISSGGEYAIAHLISSATYTHIVLWRTLLSPHLSQVVRDTHSLQHSLPHTHTLARISFRQPTHDTRILHIL